MSNPERAHVLDAAYYQQLHDHHRAFQDNNWLVDELPLLRRLGGDHLVELGCGNGRFLEAASPYWTTLTGMDWARSPHIDAVLGRCPNVRFQQQDVLAGPLPGPFDVVCSADFLEHLPPQRMPEALAALLTCGPVQFHKIACYDDGHSHLTIQPPADWLAMWHAAPGGEGMRVVREDYRKGQKDKIVLILSNAASSLD